MSRSPITALLFRGSLVSRLPPWDMYSVTNLTAELRGRTAGVKTKAQFSIPGSLAVSSVERLSLPYNRPAGVKDKGLVVAADGAWAKGKHGNLHS